MDKKGKKSLSVVRPNPIEDMPRAASIRTSNGSSMSKSKEIAAFVPPSRTHLHVPYEEIIATVERAARDIVARYGGGRTQSAIDENSYLTQLGARVHEIQPLIQFEISGVAAGTAPAGKDRSWWDFRADGIPFNLKLTSGASNDNAFNKQGILCSITGHINQPERIDWKYLTTRVQRRYWLTQRSRATEYHYLAIHKTKGFLCLKSLLDIHEYKPNSNLANVLQINWSHEALTAGEKTPDDAESFTQKIEELLGTVQRAIRGAIAAVQPFAELDFSAAVVAAAASSSGTTQDEDDDS